LQFSLAIVNPEASSFRLRFGTRRSLPPTTLLGVGDQRSIDFDPIAVGQYRLAIGQLAEDSNPGAGDVDVRMARRQTRTLERVAKGARTTVTSMPGAF
jgi:hypothetical protein